MSNKNVRVKVRALVLLEEIMDQSNAQIRPGKLKGSQKKLVIELPVVEMPEDDWNTRLAGVQNVLQYGNVVVPTLPPYAIAENVTSIAATSATLHGHAHSQEVSTVVTFEYGTTEALGSSSAATESPLSGDEMESVSVALSGLTASTKYYWRIKCVSATKTVYSLIKAFTTFAAT